MRDYEVNTSILIDTNFDDRECNELMFREMKPKIAKEISALFEKDESLSEHIASTLNFKFKGYKVWLDYLFTCHDENEDEAQSFSQSCIETNIKDELEELGYSIEQIYCEAQEMEIAWYEEFSSKYVIEMM